jgi:hypothetical protein
MTLVRIPGAFRTYPGNNIYNLQDLAQVPAANGVAVSGGATLIDSLAASPAGSQKWNLISLSMQGYLCLSCGSTGTPYGDLGRIIAGILSPTSPQQLSQGTNVPWVNPMLPLPNDMSLMTTLFDPIIDSTPALSTAFLRDAVDPLSQLTPVSATVSPPNPIQLIGGEGLSIGIWVYPSLLGCSAFGAVGLQLQYMSYTLAYDDGL